MDYLTTLWQILALIRKEILALIKEPSSRIILLTPALIQSMLFGYAATYDLKQIPYAVFDQSRSEASAHLLARLDGSDVFERRVTLESARQMTSFVDDGHAVLIVSIPADFDSRLNSGLSAPIQIILDGRNSSTAASTAASLQSIVAAYNRSMNSDSPGVVIERRAWYNPNLESRWNIMPGLIAALSMIQTILLAALSVAREREQGTFDQLLVTPLTPMQILIGKALPPIFIGLLQSTIIFLIVLLWFKVPFSGSIWLLYLGLFLFTGAAVGIGLSISALSLTMQQAMLYTFLLIMPLMLLSGLLTPVSNMPEVLQTATYINPLRFGISIVRRVYLENASFRNVAFDFIPLFALAAITLPLAAWLFRNRLS